MRECQWEKYKKENAVAMEVFWLGSKLDKERPMQRLQPRASVRGGMIETFCLKFTLDENPDYKLYFLDINSLYSKVCLDNSFGVGRYEVIVDKKDLIENISWNPVDKEYKYKNQSMKSDCCHVTWVAPSNLLFPFLPYRINNEFNYLALCKKCVLKKITKFCPHTSIKVRSFTSVYMVAEINYAKSLGYEITEFHELHHYSQETPFLAEYVKILAAEKLKNSNILDGVPDNEKKTFCDNLNQAMNFETTYELSPETVCDNLFQRNFFKDMQNSFFGRFALRTNFNTFLFCKSLREIENYASKQNTELVDFTAINDNICQIEIAQPEKSKTNLNGSLYITSQINCLSRIYLYEQMLKIVKVGGKVLACDTDSICFALRKDCNNPLEVSHKIGSFKHVINNCELLSFYSLNPRNYSILYRNEKNEFCQLLKVKGLSLKSNNSNSLISHKLYSNFVEQNFKNNIENLYIPQMRKKFNKATKSYDDILCGFTFSSETHVKRYLLKNDPKYKTYPYGFKKK